MKGGREGGREDNERREGEEKRVWERERQQGFKLSRQACADDHI